MTRPTPRSLLGVVALSALVACAPGAPTSPPASLPHASEPANVGDAKLAARAYHASGAYERDLAAVASEAGAWLRQRAPQVERPALVFDVDETALSNWEVILANDFGRFAAGPCALPEGPCGWAAWDQLGKDPPIAPTLGVFRDARELGVAVFFITGRPESQRAATERNLRAAGYGGFTGLDMVPDGERYEHAADFKAPRRAAIEEAGYTIVANIGDQPSDLAGGHAGRTFLLPNPFYRIP
jgi:predicted secreted acid phosphatase